MTIKEWLAGARRRVDGVDAELIALRVFAVGGILSEESVSGDAASRGLSGFVAGDSALAGADRSWLAAHDDMILDAEAVERAEAMISEREKGVPMAYLLGEKEFYGRNFRVGLKVLVPRPETEALIELVKELDLPEEARFLEIGTGSGCIAATLAQEFPQATVVATDVSEEALKVAKVNSERYGGRVKFYQGDLLDGLPADLPRSLARDTKRGEPGFDVLVANLPYVDENWDWLDKRALGYEPELALYVEDEGLALYKKMILQIKERGEGFVRYVVFEADPCQHEKLTQFAGGNGLVLVKIEGFGLVFAWK